MVDRDALARLATALPAGSAVPIPVEWLRELLAGAETPAKAPAPLEMDLTPDEVGTALHRSPITVRSYCNAGLFKGAYRLRGKSWRIPHAALEAFQAAERKAHNQRRPAA